MSKDNHKHHHCHKPGPVNLHTNVFVDLNGIPYLLAEYVDKREFQQLERSYVKSEINVDESEAMRALIDINIDDIGRRCSDGRPNIVGNNTKQMRLLEMINNNSHRLDHQLSTLRRGIVVRVYYQVENYTTRNVMRTMSEEFRILNRNYFLDINPRNVNDNAIISHFTDSIVSTVNTFTHGRERMVLRVTHIQMFYECCRNDVRAPRIKQMHYQPAQTLPTGWGTENDCYNYHDQCQSQQYIGCPPMYDDTYGHEDVSMISPPMWSMFNRFYRFDHNGRDIVIHGQEVNDPQTATYMIPCGSVRVNRSFMINPGHRLIFRFNIWKNDVTIVSDTTRIAQTLKAPFLDYCYDNRCDFNYEDHRCDCHDPIDPDYESIVRMLHDNHHMNDMQNCAINQLTQAVCSLQEIVRSMAGFRPDDPDDPTVNPSEPENPGTGDEGDNKEPDTGDNGSGEDGDDSEEGDTGDDNGDLSVEHPEETGEVVDTE